MKPAIIEIRELSCQYPKTDPPRYALSDVSFDVNEGEVVVVSGRNDSGKSTLLSCVSSTIPRLVSAQLGGCVTVRGRPIQDYSIHELASAMGVVLDDPDAQLFGTSALHFLVFGLEMMGFPRERMIERVEEAARQVGVSKLLDRDCRTLSGGEKQRLVVASMLVMRPSIMVLDEPTSQLDPVGTRDLFAVLKNLNREFGLTVIVSSHKLAEIQDCATHLIVLRDGRLVMHGQFREVIAQSFQEDLIYPQAAELYLGCRQRNYDISGPLPLSVNEGVDSIKALIGSWGA